MPAKLLIKCKNLVNGKYVDPEGKHISSYDPATGALVGTAPSTTLEGTREAIECAKSAFEKTDWSKNPIARAKALYAAASALSEQFEDLVDILVRDAGKTTDDAQRELNLCIDTLEYNSGLARNLFGRTVDLSPTSFAILVREPIGVVGVITPWNYPLILLVRSLAPALAAGNSVVIKPASLTPVVNFRLVEAMQKTGKFPPGILNCVTGPGGVVGSELASSKDVDMISFTGETETGKEIIRLSTSNIKRLGLELGGKSPNIIFKDAPFDKAIKAAMKGIFMGSGQVCFAGSRLLVQEDVHEAFLKRAKEIAKSMKVGCGINPDVDLGPLISKDQLDKVLTYIEGAKEYASLEVGGKRVTGGELSKGNFVEPTIFDRVPSDSPIGKEEIFGPVLSVMPFRDEREAIQIANDTEYGLAAAVWTKDIERALTVARGVNAGTVWINTYGKNYAAAEFGGFKQSGVGRLRGIDGLNDFTEMKHINIDTAPDFL